MVFNDITCINATFYKGMLTRGRTYRIIEIDESKNCVKLVCDNGRTRLFDSGCFDFEGKPVPMLIEWNYDDDPIKAEKDDEFLSWVEVSFKLSTGEKRWCKLITPSGLQRILNLPNSNPAGIYIPHLIIVKSYSSDDVDNMLKWMDENNELISASIPYRG